MYHKLNSRYFDISRINNLVRFNGPRKGMYGEWGLKFNYENSGKIRHVNFGYYETVSWNFFTAEFEPDRVVATFNTLDELNKQFFMLTRKLDMHHAKMISDIEELESRIRLENPNLVPLNRSDPRWKIE